MPPLPARWLLREGWAIGPCTDAPAGEAPPAVARWEPLAGPEPLAAWLQGRGEGPAPDGTRDLDAESWCWRLSFDGPPSWTSETVLGLDGLATICDVWLNGAPLLHSESMFQAHRPVVGDRLRERGNELLIQARALTPRLAERRPRPRWRVPMLRQQQLRWWRTTLLGRTPGWSPSLPPVGPWRPVWLGDAASLLPERLRLRPRVDGPTGWLDIALPDAPAQPLHLELQRDGRSHRVRLQRQADGLAQGRLRIDAVERWWPHTHGEPALYAATLWLGDGPSARALPLAPVGFRSLEWSCDGGDFALSVNGVPVFARGACWTPPDPLRLHTTEAACTEAIAAVRAAGLNMLRVCGPMAYESEAFHRACDAAGVLVWQDFMFANMDYPAEDTAFLETVRREVEQQLLRWQGSPSLALLCGNSEVEQQAAMLGMDRAAWTSPLFDRQLPDWCAALLPDTRYWPSSAHGGPWPFAPGSGTCSYYGVGAYQRPLDDARTSGLRFASECLAFAQVPEGPALDRLPGGRALRVHSPAWKQGSPRDLGAGWDFEDVRDHYLAEICGVDPAALRRHDHERYLMLSRVAVARVVEAGFSRWRSTGSGCRGALVWFLRDLQPGAGWGFLDDQGAPKSGWHALARVLQPVALLITDEGLNGLRLHLVNETAEPLDAVLTLGAYQGTRCLHQVRQPQHLAPRTTRPLDVAELLPHFSDLAWAYRFGPPPADLVQAVLHDADGRERARAHHLCAGWPAALDDTPSLQAQARRQADGSLVLDLHAARLALAVQIEVAGHLPQEAGFDLAPGERRTLRLRPAGAPPRVLRGAVQAANHRWPVTVQGLEELAP